MALCIVLMTSIKFSVDCSLCLDSSVRGFSTLVKYLDSWQVQDPQEETMGRTGMLSLCSIGSPYSLGGCGILHLSLLQRRKQILSVFFSVGSLLLSLRCSAGVGSRSSTSQVCLSLASESILSLQSVLSITTVTRLLSAVSMTMFSSVFSRFSAFCLSGVKLLFGNEAWSIVIARVGETERPEHQIQQPRWLFVQVSLVV